MTSSPRVLVAGSTGYLGLHIVKQLIATGHDFIAVARNKQKLVHEGVSEGQILEAQVTKPNDLEGVCDGVDVVISCLGITRQKDGLSYMDVDYQANLNLLLEAENAGVSKFIYISAFNAPNYPDVRILRAKEKFATRLLNSEKLHPCVIRPNGFFVDLEEVYHMAKKGRVYQFGSGAMKINPIHGADLAQFCLQQIESDEREVDVGGPEALSINQIAQVAFEAQQKQVAITSIPDSVRRMLIWLMAKLPDRYAGGAEFFLTMLGSDSVAPKYGTRTLAEHFAQCNQKPH